MYIVDKYWGNYIGGTDDSLTLVEYLAGKQKEEISLGEIFSDFGLDKLHGDFRVPEEDMLEMASVCEQLRKELYEAFS